jgi:hypothetical protein
MKHFGLSGIAFAAIVSAATAFAQTSATSQTPPSTPTLSGAQTITMSGCVANNKSGTQGFVLSNPIVLPSTGGAATASAAPSSSATAGGSTASSAATQPPTSSAGTAATAHPVTGAGAGTAATAGTSGTAGTGATVGTSGTAVTGAAGAAASTPAMNGYRLTGSDLAQWAGKRVEVTGTFGPSTTANTTINATGAASSTLQEFKVVNVKPIGGSCPQ